MLQATLPVLHETVGVGKGQHTVPMSAAAKRHDHYNVPETLQMPAVCAAYIPAQTCKTSQAPATHA